HAAAVIALLTVGHDAVKRVVIETFPPYNPPIRQGGDGRGGVAPTPDSTPKVAVAVPTVPQPPQEIPTEIAEATPEPGATPLDPNTSSLPGFGPRGPVGPGVSEGPCEGPSCGDCVGPNCSTDPVDFSGAFTPVP